MPKEDIRYTFSATRQSQHTEYDIEMHTNTVETIGTHAHTHRLSILCEQKRHSDERHDDAL